jgi:citrate lyase synthetase
MQIRKIQESDYIYISRIIIKNTKLKTSKFYKEDIINDFIKNSWVDILKTRFIDRECFVLEDNEKIIWNICVKNNEIKTFYIDYNYQQKWLWRKLFEFIEKILFEKNINNIVVYSLVWSEWFYKKLWFKCVQNVKNFTDLNKLEYNSIYMKKIITWT